MISILLEDGARLQRLSKNQMRLVKEAFILYLVHEISFREASAICLGLLEDDQIEEADVIRERLSTMIEDHYCNTVIKPAIIRLAAGDASVFRANKCSTQFVRWVISRNKRAFRNVLKSVCFEDLTPKGIRDVEMDYLVRVESHSKNYVMNKARFLCSAEHGLSVRDLVSDLQILALRAFRWYFPFRNGLHMLNTMRATITNRGRSLVKYSTADSRRRLIMLDSGEMYNRESSGNLEEALNSEAGSVDPRRAIEIGMDLQRMSENRRLRPIVSFIGNPDAQDAFVGWAGYRYGRRFDNIEQLAEYLRKHNKSYIVVLSHFLNLHPRRTQLALRELQKVV